jgi:hypothetical protein
MLVGSGFPIGPKQIMLAWFSSGIIILPLRFWKKRAEIRDATEEREMYLWDLGDRRHRWKSGS